ncbi:MAG: amino acid permease [Dehalobacterium sp.]
MDNQDGFNSFGQDTADFQDILITKRITDDFLRNQGLKKVWTAKYLWSLGIGTVLTGFYTQWKVPGEIISSFSFLTALGVVGLLYAIYFVFVAELAVLFPYAGGHYAFARRGLGNFGGYVAGTSSVFQFIFGAAALSQLFKRFIMDLIPDNSAGLIVGIIIVALMVLYVFSTGISARVQMYLVGFGISGLFIFFIGCLEGKGDFSFVQLHYLPFWTGFATAVPLVIWYFLGLEGLSLVAEETKNPQRILPVAMITTVGTVFLFVLGVWFFAVRLLPDLFFQSNGQPLLFILQKVQSHDTVLHSTFLAVSMCVYISGLNGLINGFSRQVYTLARGGYYPLFIDKLHSVYRTPYLAILIPGIVVLGAFLLIQLNILVYFSLLSALLGHLLVLISYCRIHKFEPILFRFRGFVNHPILLYIVISLILTILVIILFACGPDIIYLLLLWSVACFYYFLWAKYHIRDEAPEESAAVQGEKRIKIDFR